MRGQRLPPVDFSGPRGRDSEKRCPRCGARMRVANITYTCSCGHSETKAMARRRLPGRVPTFVERLRASIPTEGEVTSRPEFQSFENDPDTSAERNTLLLACCASLMALVLVWRHFEKSSFPREEITDRMLNVHFAIAAVEILWFVLMLLALAGTHAGLKRAMLLLNLLSLPFQVALLTAWLPVDLLAGISFSETYSLLALPRMLLCLWSAFLLWRDLRYLLSR